MTWEQAGERSRPLRCPLCQGTAFERQVGLLVSRRGLTTLTVAMRIRRSCGLLLRSSAGVGISVFD